MQPELAGQSDDGLGALPARRGDRVPAAKYWTPPPCRWRRASRQSPAISSEAGRIDGAPSLARATKFFLCSHVAKLLCRRCSRVNRFFRSMTLVLFRRAVNRGHKRDKPNLIHDPVTTSDTGNAQGLRRGNHGRGSAQIRRGGNTALSRGAEQHRGGAGAARRHAGQQRRLLPRLGFPEGRRISTSRCTARSSRSPAS